MRRFLLVIALLAAPATAQMRQTPLQMMTEMGVAPDPEARRAAIEAAAAHPLGSARNPVRVSGPQGQQAYLARLRCADGQPPRIGQRANTGMGPFGTIVDAYALDCGRAAPGQVRVAMDMYHDDHVETGAPDGFTIVP